MWVRGAHGGKEGWRKQKAVSEPVIFWVDRRSRRVLNEVPSEEHAPQATMTVGWIPLFIDPISHMKRRA
jgi:hypothetical protein